MRRVFRRLVHPATRADLVDVEGTRAHRQRTNQAIRQRQRLLSELLAQERSTELGPE